jgi:hypothetical protein
VGITKVDLIYEVDYNICKGRIDKNYMPKHLEKQKLDEIKVLLKTGQISYEEAKKQAKPYLDKMNEKIIRISKEMGFSSKTISFAGFMR